MATDAEDMEAFVAEMQALRQEQKYLIAAWCPRTGHFAVNSMVPEKGWRMEASAYDLTLRKCDDEIARAEAAVALAQQLKDTPMVDAGGELRRAEKEVVFMRSVTRDFLANVDVAPDGTHDRISQRLAEMAPRLRAFREGQIRLLSRVKQ